ncbi:putative ribonuclease H-like superfamily [Helianthus debilis subsp. tardiflorus]
MFWTPCAAHCVNLMIQDIGEKIPKIKSALNVRAAGCYLNPAIFHADTSKDLRKNPDIAAGLYVAIDRLVPNLEDNNKVRQDLNLYIDLVGHVGSPAATRARTKVAPFKLVALHLPCERNWSTFDNLHSKKRNCLLQQKLNDLVFIQYNTRLQRRFNSLKTNKSLDPILLRDVEKNDDWVIPTEIEHQDFVDGSYGLLWSVAQEAMGGNEDVGPSTRSKRERHRDDDDDDARVNSVEVENLDEQLDSLVDVDSEEDFIAYD